MRLRRLFYRLPGRWQLAVRAARRAVTGRHDWAGPVRRLRRQEAHGLARAIAAAQPAGGRRRIAFFLLQHYSPVEYGLATALRLRGHDIRAVLCDGLLPLCEMSLGPTVRPPCEACHLHFARYADAVGQPFARLSNYLTDDDRRRAEALVAAVPDEALGKWVVGGVPVGRYARRELQRHRRGFVFEPAADPAWRAWMVAGVLATWLSARWLDEVRPDLVGVCSGRTLATACLFDVARQRGLRVVTWDGAATHPDTLVFSHNRRATEVPLDEAWAGVRDEALAPEARARLHAFLDRWARSGNTPFPYNPAPVADAAEVRRRLGLRPGAPLVAVYTNTAWDIAVTDRDVGFESMFAWLFALVDLAAGRPDVDLVVRAHPAETQVPRELRSRTPVPDALSRRYGTLPANVRVIPGDSPLSSYTLADLATVNAVYATRFGLELAIRGRRPWVGGAVTYRGKGFTTDLASPEHLHELWLSGPAEDRLTPADVERAERFAYLWFFRAELKLPLLRPPDRRFGLRSFEALGPGGDPVLDRVCDRFLTGQPFVDLNEPRLAGTPER